LHTQVEDIIYERCHAFSVLNSPFGEKRDLWVIGIELENCMTLQTFYHTSVRARPALRWEKETSRQDVTRGVLGTRDSEGPVRSLWQAPSLTLATTKKEPHG
jgi:hypothetical protein